MCSPREERLVKIKLPMQNFEFGKFIHKLRKSSFSDFPYWPCAAVVRRTVL